MIIFTLNSGGVLAVIVISDDASGGECTLVGTWDDLGNVCTLSQDIFETGEIQGGIVIGNFDGVTLDCDGFTVDTGSQGGPSSVTQGITVNSSTDVTVRNCVVTHAFFGVKIFQVADSFVIGNTIRLGNSAGGAGNGMRVEKSNGNVIENNVSKDYARGISLATIGGIGNDGNSVRNNTLSGGSGIWIDSDGRNLNTLFGNMIDQAGISIAVNNRFNLIEQTTITHIDGVYSNIGINVGGGPNQVSNEVLNNIIIGLCSGCIGINNVNNGFSVIRGNTVDGQGNGSGIVAAGTAQNVGVEGNKLNNLAIGLNIGAGLIGDKNIVVNRNRVIDSTGLGSSDASILVTGYDGVVLERNNVRNAIGRGILMANGDNHLVTRNRVRDSGSQGLEIRAMSTSSSYERNSFCRSAGFDIADGNTIQTWTNNRCGTISGSSASLAGAHYPDHPEMPGTPRETMRSDMIF